MFNSKTKKAGLIVTTTVLSSAISAALYAAPKHIDDLVFEEEFQLAGARAVASQLPKRYIVKYKSNNGNAQKMGMAKAGAKSRALGLGARIKAEFNNINVLAAELTPSAALALRQDANVEYVEEDLPRRFMSQTQPYGIGMVQADQVDDAVASAAAGGKKICVIDSGLELPHEDMGAQGATIGGTNDSGTGNWYDHGGPHGTHVAGTIAALNNGIGVRGVIGSDPSMHIVKVFNESGWGYSSSLVSAINTCVSNGSDVINMSLGGSGSSTTEANGIQAAYDAGVLLIAAAGNSGDANSATDAKSYPASYDSVVSVAAIDSSKVLAGFSQKNDQVEIAGPGVDVYSTYPTGTGSVVETSVGGTGYNTTAMENTGTASGTLFDMGTGEATNSGANGKVCLIQRGNISFHDKVKNCQDSGGVAAILYNNAAGSFGGTLGDTNSTSIPAVTTSDTNGAAMKAQAGQTASVNIGSGNYGMMSGTSMASPHVAGVAALVWSTHPSCTNQEIRDVLNGTAEDLGTSGRDVSFGYGLVQTKDAIDYITANGCDGNGGNGGGGNGGGTGEDNVLANGVAATDLSAATGTDVVYTMEVPAGATDISFVMSGGTGDADMYVKFGATPTDSSYDCRPYAGGNSESCTATSTGGTYYVRLKAYSAFSGVSLTGSFTPEVIVEPPVSDNVLVNGVATTGIAGAAASETFYTFEVAEGTTSLDFEMSGGSGDADMYVKFGSQPTTASYDCRPYKGGNSESCTINSIQAGTYHVMVRGYSAYADVSLKATATAAAPIDDTLSESNLSGAKSSVQYFTLEVPAGRSTVSINMTGGSGDADMYVRFGSQPTTSTYDCRPYKTGNTESCSISAQAGTYHIMVRGYSAFSGVSLEGSSN